MKKYTITFEGETFTASFNSYHRSIFGALLHVVTHFHGPANLGNLARIEVSPA